MESQLAKFVTLLGAAPDVLTDEGHLMVGQTSDPYQLSEGALGFIWDVIRLPMVYTFADLETAFTFIVWIFWNWFWVLLFWPAYGTVYLAIGLLLYLVTLVFGSFFATATTE